jgi:hypothetical protein
MSRRWLRLRVAGAFDLLPDGFPPAIGEGFRLKHLARGVHAPSLLLMKGGAFLATLLTYRAK